MAGIIGFFSDIFGYILNWIYNIDFIRNYGLAIIIFTIVIKIVLLPITIKQQKTMKKTAKIQEESKKIQEKYSGNQEKMNQEMLELYKRENMSPCSGCFSGIIQIILLLSVFYLVSQPLTHMRKINKEYPDLIQNYINEIKEQDANQTIAYPEINVIREKGPQDERVNINMEFLGLDLSNVPSGALNNIKVYIIPVLYVITSIISIKISTKVPQKNVPDEDKKGDDTSEIDLATQMNKNMTLVMPIMSVMIAMVAPLGLALYWLTNNILTIIERLCMNKWFKEGEE